MGKHMGWVNCGVVYNNGTLKMKLEISLKFNSRNILKRLFLELKKKKHSKRNVSLSVFIQYSSLDESFK